MRQNVARLARDNTAVAVVLVGFLSLGITYSAVVPLFESPDEVWHYEYVRYLADGHGLPVSDLVSDMPWHQEGSQPPLYYLLGAILTSWVDTRDAGEVIRYNPHAAVGLADATDNKNMMVHTRLESFPWRRTTLAVHIVRSLSVLMGACTVVSTYAIALEVAPGRRRLAAVAAAIAAFNPQFVFISASVNNDSLVVLLCSVAILLLIRIWKELIGSLPQGRAPGRNSRWHLIALGVIAGLGALTKLNGLVLLPFIALVLGIAAWRRRSIRALIAWAVATGIPVIALAGWWYWRNYRLYGDPFGLAAMYAVLPARSEGPGVPELIARAQGVWRSAWAVFGWFNVTAEPWLYAVYSALSVVGFMGVAVLVIRCLKADKRRALARFLWLLLWTLVVLASLVGWSQKRYPQGRLLFPAIASSAALLASGIAQLAGRLPISARRAGAGILGVGLFFLALWAPFRYIVPTYSAPRTISDLPPNAKSITADFGGQVGLLGYHLPRQQARPGETLEVTLYWQALTSMERDYSVFIHLVDTDGLILAQRDSYPGGGTLVTSEWPPSAVVVDDHTVEVPATVPSPAETAMQIGLYDHDSGVRLADAAGHDKVTLASIAIQPREDTSGLPNPVYFDFEGKLALVGFDMDRRVIAPGETLHLDLFWECLSPMQEDYAVFTHLLLPPDEVWAQKDAQPRGGQAPTSTWEPGQIVDDHYELAVPLTAPQGTYELEIGLYNQLSGDRLKVGLSDEGIVLGRVRVRE
jgi:4-amino-4-deoxy-L-arabinose transferase-like glycosyltransferase